MQNQVHEYRASVTQYIETLAMLDQSCPVMSSGKRHQILELDLIVNFT